MTLPANPDAPDTRDVDLFNRAEPRALINLVPGAVADAFLETSQKRTDLLGLDEKTLYRTLRQEECTPTPTDNRLRLKFWDEYDRAQATQTGMDMISVFAGICTKDYFYGRYLKAPEKVAWLLNPPASYTIKMEEALSYGVDQLREILDMPLVNSQGRFDVKLAELKAKIVAMLDVRVKGAVVQKVENTNKNMSLNVQTSDRALAEKLVGASMSDLEKRLKELERRERRALNLPEDGAASDKEVIDITPGP